MTMRSMDPLDPFRVRNSGNFISMSKRTSFILCLADLSNVLFGSENEIVISNNSILSTYSKEGYQFLGKEQGSKKVPSM